MSPILEKPHFDVDVHLKCGEPSFEQLALISEFRSLILKLPLYENHEEWADDMQLLRFLIARKFKLSDSLDLIKGALKWREHRKPGQIEQSHYWPHRISKESETGKIYCPGYDKWGRSILVLDNTVENTKSVDDQMIFLAWNLEFAIKLMKPNVDKYLVFMHLGAFSFFNTPPMSATKETMNMLCNCFPERLGHCIAYQPPAVFRVFFNSVKGFLDEKTASKMVFVIGDVSTGSANDLLMKSLVGDDWKALVGVEQPVAIKGNSPGYNHDTFWPSVLDRLAALSHEGVTPTEQNTPSGSKQKKDEVLFANDQDEQDEEDELELDNERAELIDDDDEEAPRISRRNSAHYRSKQSFSESVVRRTRESPLDELDVLLIDLLHFLTYIGLAVLLFEWRSASTS